MRDGKVATVVDNHAEIEERVVKHADDHHLAGLKVLPMRAPALAM
jgi:predicted small metal-binding protein